ncbi:MULTISPECIES: nucleotidyltransferase domain-containing protein [Bacillus]|uniref:Nucleotidyltransferase n=1 Tax=Bacillus thuringiensis TaxID=1428 RepID=A0A9X7BTX7_BACTU|nr:nucleotidyltransferase domain-containing protein [Bacillus thuringiensis]PFV35804.1 nucleotidyltransferase [Bacillus thuringiensis]HDX9674184.1 nucleotidyltransferase domain-containing protein [Bacillus cereus]
MNENVKQELDQLVGKIRESNSDVRKIILFGSHAYGTPSPDSDFDLCVVVDGVGKRKREVSKNIKYNLYDILDTPVDLLVYGPDEFNERAARNVTMEYKIAEEGKILYEKH